MKITGIRFLNLNSLKGSHEVRFDRPPFTESGLFAITGPTGAGKTTILDAITVALYGRVHRHDRDASESMTRFTGESSAEVEFEVNNRHYRAKWSIRRSHNKPDGALQTPRMELADAGNGEIIIGHPLSAVQNKIVELCGLDYNQFLRSVMLSQGDFTRFLKASENERSELLEKITDTGIYSEISTYVYEKTREKKALLDTLRGRMNDVVLLSAEEKNAISTSLQQQRAEAAGLRTVKAGIESNINWLQKISGLEGKRRFHTAELEQFEQQALTHAPDFERLNQHRRAAVHLLALQAVTGQEKQRTEIEGKIEGLQQRQPLLLLQATQAAVTSAAAATAYEKVQETLRNTEPLLEVVLVRDTEIEAKKTQLAAETTALAVLEKEVKNAVKQRDAKQQELAACSTKIMSLEEWLHEHQQDAGLENVLPQYQRLRKDLAMAGEAVVNATAALKKYSTQQKEELRSREISVAKVSEIEKSITEIRALQVKTAARLQQATGDETLESIEAKSSALPALVALCKDQLRHSLEHQRLLDKQQQLQGQLENGEQQYVVLQCELMQLEVDKKQAEALMSDLQQLVELQMRIQKYDADRQQLEPGKPCPLCGSVIHPYLEGNYSSQVNQAVRQRNSHKQSLDTLLQTHSKKTLAANTLFANLGALKVEMGQVENAINDTAAAFERNNEALPKPLAIGDSKLIAALVASKESGFKKLQEQITTIRNLQKEAADLESRLNSRQQELTRAQGVVMQAEERMKAVTRDLQRVQEDLETQRVAHEKISNEAHSLLSSYGIAYDQARAHAIETELQDRLVQYNRCVKELHALKIDIGRIEAESNSLHTAYLDKLGRQQQQEAQAAQQASGLKQLQSERNTLFGDRDPGEERKRLNTELLDAKVLEAKSREELHAKQQAAKVNEEKTREWESQLQLVGEKYRSLLAELEQQLATAGIGSIEALQAMFISAEEEQRLSQLKNETDLHISTTTGILRTVKEELRVEVERQLTTESEAELTAKQSETEELISRLNQQAGALQQRLDADAETEARYKEVAAQVEVQKSECSRWDKISQLIGSADGKKFSKFAQGLTLARLTELANRHLRQLSDRYQVVKSAGKDLELQIVDAYQADVVRPMTTLSGGESFLVSLSLALGLSDLAGSKTQINSLFIDEGFGTLDAETLDVAVSALENLQASGKMIGIISHVEALKERIGTQVEVSKQPGGYSRIRVKSYGKEYVI